MSHDDFKDWELNDYLRYMSVRMEESNESMEKIASHLEELNGTLLLLVESQVPESSVQVPEQDPDKGTDTMINALFTYCETYAVDPNELIDKLRDRLFTYKETMYGSKDGEAYQDHGE